MRTDFNRESYFIAAFITLDSTAFLCYNIIVKYSEVTTMENIIIRNETEKDYRAVEELTREAFWNVYVPGASEHYFVHTMRNHPDFIPELAFVLEKDGEIIGNIMYTKAWLEDEDGNRKEILSFGPLCVAPKYQRQKLGKILIEHSFDVARKMGYDVNINFGNPGNYVSRGFVSCKKKDVSFVRPGNYPTALLVCELIPGALAGKKWMYIASTAADCCDDEAAVEAFDSTFPPKEKAWAPSQEEFYIYRHSSVVR
jgi:predicted N-acetyltransferase YhbS